jgi:hypothetical protein
MIKGSIEEVTTNSVAGWIFVEGTRTRDRHVLAFLDKECIGSGQVELFRQDLADAGLDDGFLGYRLRIREIEPKDTRRVTIRLEGSDAVLLQADSRLSDTPGEATKAPLQLRPEASLQWMLERGWLGQAEYDFLKFIDRFGIYERSMVVPKTADGAPSPSLLDPRAVTKSMLELYAMSEIELTSHNFKSFDDLSREIRRLAEEDGAVPVVALFSTERIRFGVGEGSHLSGAGEGEIPSLLVDYACGPDRLLFLHGTTSFVRRPGNPAANFVLLTGKTTRR